MRRHKLKPTTGKGPHQSALFGNIYLQQILIPQPHILVLVKYLFTSVMLMHSVMDA